MKTTYIAGPMRGYPQCNFPAFQFAASVLRAAGWSVWSPAEHDLACGFDPNGSLDDFDIVAAFTWDIQHVLLSDAVHVLPHWESSRGAIVEVLTAVMFHKPIYKVLGLSHGTCIFARATIEELCATLPIAVAAAMQKRRRDLEDKYKEN